MKLDILRTFFQNCWYCENPTWSAYTLCAGCRDGFLFQVAGLPKHNHKIENLPLHFLTYYEYGIEEKLIFSLKKAECSLLNFDFIGEIFVARMILQGISLRNVIWVTPESKHSVEIVKSINKITGLNMPEIILKERTQKNRKAQKFRKREERRERSFNFQGSPIDKTKNFLFIDDVVVTGSTALAAWFALGKPTFFQIWSVAYRPRLAPSAFV